ncbi:MAG: radical SAM protein [Candidatus Omnitrophota bacterium]
MRLTFLGLGWEQLGLAQLSAIAREHGHQTGLAFSAGLFNDRYNLHIPLLAACFNDDADVVSEIIRQKPDALVCSPLTSTYQWTLEIVKEVRLVLPGVKTIFGGVHVSAVPERVILRDEVDYLCVGEGDRAFLRILEAVSRNGSQTPIENVWFKTSGGAVVRGAHAGLIENLDELPFFDKTLFEDFISYEDIYFTMASRGCPYRCFYCFNDYFSRLGKGQYVRYRSPEHVMKELIWAKDRYRLRLIEFEDDVFTLNKQWLKRLLFLYREQINLPFQCLTHPRCMDEETAKALAEAGCRYVQIGIQSLDDDYKHRIMRRPETKEEVERALAVMKRYGLKAKIDHMFALPGEPVHAQEQALELYRRYPPYRMQTFWTNYFPKTTIVDYALAMGAISHNEKDGIEEGRVPDHYRNSGKVGDARKKHFYLAYECCFKALTVLPLFAAKKLSVKIFFWLPDFILSSSSFMMDLISGLIKGNPDHWAYARHYGRHLFGKKGKAVIKKQAKVVC